MIHHNAYKVLNMMPGNTITIEGKLTLMYGLKQ